ncbi:fimbrial protein [Bordetella pertussis]|nr:fimbrial protein [Bordetella pertussis]
MAPAAPGGAPPGSAFTLTLTNVGAACPALASVMQRVSDIIAVQGKAGPVVVKNALAVPALPYRAQAAQAQCVAGDRNTFVFTAR